MPYNILIVENHSGIECSACGKIIALDYTPYRSEMKITKNIFFQIQYHSRTCPKNSQQTHLASKVASDLKAELMEMSDECFAPLTFGELKIGQKFISLPCPGDNHGHGGFRGAHHLFTKTCTKAIKDEAGFPISTSHGMAEDNQGITHNLPNDMFVILVE